MGDIQSINPDLYSKIFSLISNTQQNMHLTVNRAMVQTYWAIGQLIVEDEQQGETRAEYGKATIKELGKRLTTEFGKGFNERNLRYMRLFFQLFPKWNAVRAELSWTHYRHLLKVENEQAQILYDINFTWRQLCVVHF